VDAGVRKAHNLLWACRRAYGVTWGLRPKVVYWLYIPIVRPSSTFASLVWWPSYQTASVKKRLSRVQRLASLGIMGMMCATTTTSAMDILSIMMWLQQSVPIFNMGVHVMRPAFNSEPKYRVTVLTREEWTRGPGTPPVVKGLVWFTDGSGVSGISVGRRISISLGRYVTVFQAELYATLACAYEIQLYGRSEKHVSICSASPSGH
jgi:hypothetical protein